MAKDPAFLFYPGDYLRDTQCLSEKSQVAYDRIMCEHMRNISSDMNKIGVSQDQLNFFTKRLNEEEKADLLHVLKKEGALYQIEWVALSICKRRNYSESRAENRRKKPKEDMKSHLPHMENAIENENIERIIKQLESLNNIRIEDVQKNIYMFLVVEMAKIFVAAVPEYFFDKETDYSACLQIAYNIAEMKKWSKVEVLNGRMNDAIESWKTIVEFIKKDDWLNTRSLTDISTVKEWQRLVLKMKKPKKNGSGAIAEIGKTFEPD
jgi:hypothetical protein